jgi:hypothetical protein
MWTMEEDPVYFWAEIIWGLEISIRRCYFIEVLLFGEEVRRY